MKTLPAAIILFMLCTPGVAENVDAIGTGTMEIRRTLILEETQTVDFSTIPLSDGECTMRNDGSLRNQCAGFGPGTPGAFRITGTSRQNVIISVSPGASVDGVTYNPVLRGNSSRRLNSEGLLNINVAGSLTLQSVSNGGQKNLTYVLTVNYQ